MSAQESERVKVLANAIVRALNHAESQADALTALQLVVASVLDTAGIPIEVWTHRVIVSIERIRSGELETKEPTTERCGDRCVWKGCARAKGHEGGHSTYDIGAKVKEPNRG